MSDTKKLDYMDYFRGIAILFVVGGHSLCWGSGTMYKFNWLLFTGGTYFFVFIAGFLFQHLAYKFDVRNFFKKKFLNVISPYLFMILPAAYLWAFHSKTPIILVSSSKFSAFVAMLLNGGCVNAPTWFVGMITIIFILSPFILRLKQKNTKAFITLFICSFIFTIISSRHNIDTHATTLIKFLLLNSVVYFKNACHCLFFYVLGMVLNDFIKKYSDIISQNLKTIFKISLFVYLFHFIVHLFIVKTKAVNNIQCLSKLLEIFVLMSGLMLAENKIRSKVILDKVLRFLAKYSFGIFFIHAYVHYVILKLLDVKFRTLVGANSIECCLSSYGLFFAVLGISILLLFLIKTVLNKLGVKNTRMFIGV